VNTRYAIIILALSLSGCANPITSWLNKRHAEQQAQAVQAISAQVQPLLEASQKQHDADVALAANQAALAAQQKVRLDVLHQYVLGAGQALSLVQNPSDEVVVAQTLTSYAEQGFDPLTDQQKQWITQLVKGLVAKNAADRAAAAKQLADSQAALQQTRAKVDTLTTENAALTVDKAAAVQQETEQRQALGSLSDRATAVAAKLTAALAKQSWWKSLIVCTLWAVGLPWLFVYVLLPLAAAVYPPLLPLSLTFEKVGHAVLHAIFLPIHSFLRMFEAKVTAKLSTIK
jgi:hypothetical protein